MIFLFHEDLDCSKAQPGNYCWVAYRSVSKTYLLVNKIAQLTHKKEEISELKKAHNCRIQFGILHKWDEPDHDQKHGFTEVNYFFTPLKQHR